MANDVMSGMERYDRLKAEFDQFCKVRGPLKLHGIGYLTGMLVEVVARIRLLELEPDDDYQSGAAALILWKDFQSRIVSTIRDKTR